MTARHSPTDTQHRWHRFFTEQKNQWLAILCLTLHGNNTNYSLGKQPFYNTDPGLKQRMGNGQNQTCYS